MPLLGIKEDENGSVYIDEFFMRDQHDSYVCEGPIMALIATLLSLVFLQLIRSERFTEDGNILGSKQILFLLVCAFYGVKLYTNLFKLKTPWYTSNFQPPSHFMKGPLSRNQGTNI